MAATLSTISFDDVTLGASVRFTTIEAKQYLSVRDLIMCLCEKDMASPPSLLSPFQVPFP